MNMMRKYLSIALLCLMFVSSFTGCGTDKKEPVGSQDATVAQNTQTKEETKTESETAPAKEVSLRFSWWGGDARHKATLEAIDLYMVQNPNVTIETEYMAFDGYQKKLMMQFAGDAAPDVFQNVASWFPDIDSANFLDLNEYANIIDLTAFNDALKTENTYVGRLQGLSAGILSTTTLFNTDFFDKYSIAKDTVWTWEKLIEVGKKVHEQDPNVYLTTGDLDVINRLFLLPHLSQKTGEIWINDQYEVQFDKATLVESLQYISDLFSSGTMEPLGTTTAFIGKMEQNPKWVNGEIGIDISLTSGLAGMMAASPSSHFDVTEIPLRDDAKQTAAPIRSSVIYSINGNTENPEEAAKFMNWMLNSPEAAMILKEQRGTPGSDISRQALVDNNAIDPLIAKAMDIATVNPGKAPNAITENSEISQINKDVITKIAYGDINAEQGAEELLKGYEMKLEELKQKVSEN